MEPFERTARDCRVAGEGPDSRLAHEVDGDRHAAAQEGGSVTHASAVVRGGLLPFVDVCRRELRMPAVAAPGCRAHH